MITTFPRRRALRLCTFVLFCLSLAGSARAQTNSWTSPVSGNWEDVNWSLGVLPGSNQMVQIANHGWKAVAIGPNTSFNFPQTMTINALSVTSPGTDTVNTVLLNYAGFQTPLITQTLYVGTNAALVILQSALLVSNGGSLTVGGTVTHDVSSEVTLGGLGILTNGVYNLANGSLTVPMYGAETINAGGTFLQEGGSNFCFGLNDNGEYELSDGDLVASGGDGPSGGIWISGDFAQSGGVVSGWLYLANGTYELSGGILNTPAVQLPPSYPESGSLVQTGGTNLLGTINIGCLGVPPLYDGSGGYGHYVLTNGTLITSNLAMNGRGSVSQSGGLHSNTLITISSSQVFIQNSPGEDSYWIQVPGVYTLGGGTFISGSVSMQTSDFYQSGGSSQIASLQLGDSKYSMSGGQLVVSNLVLSASSFFQTGGAISQSGTLTVADSALTVGAGTQHFGPLQLEITANTNFPVTFPSAPCVLHFGDCSHLAWSNQVTLLITNWSGSLSGGGLQQILVGTNHTGLTTQQLKQIKFQNPAGVSPGTYSAVILTNGEIIPDPGATMSRILPPQLTLASQSNGAIRVQLQGAAGVSYAIQVSSNLMNWTPWTNQFNTNGTFGVYDANAMNPPQRFYRAVLMP